MDALGFSGLSSPLVLATVALVIVAASLVQFGLGMGFGLMAAPLLALLDPALVPAPTLVLGMLTSGWGAWSERSQIRWDEVGIGTIGRIAGVAAAIAAMTQIRDQRAFLLVFGLLVGLAVILSLAGRRLAFTRPNLVAMSALSGLMATFTSVGAPPLALVYQGRPAKEARPTLAAFFAVGCLIALAGLFSAGLAGWRHVALAGLMLPPMIVGRIVSRRLKGRFDHRYRAALLTLAGTVAVLLVARGLS